MHARAFVEFANRVPRASWTDGVLAQGSMLVSLVPCLPALVLGSTLAPPAPPPFYWVDSAGERRLGGRSPKLCTITSYGAVPGSSNSTHAGPSSTRAIQAAIDDCGAAPGGGTVLIPSGRTFVSGSLFLRSNITLRVEENATLLGATALDAWRTDDSSHPEYPWVYDRLDWWGMFRAGLINGPRCTAHPHCPRPAQDQSTPHCGPNGTYGDLCTARERLVNVVITGEGTIDGNGRNPGKRGGWWQAPNSNNRPLLVTPSFIDGLTIHGGLTITDGANWQTHPMFCNHVWISNLTVASVGVPNGDGIDPDSCSDVLIEDCDLATGDDCIAIKSGRNEDGLADNVSTQDVLIRNMHFAQGHGVSIGSETSGGVHNVTLTNLTMDGTANGMRVKSAKGRGNSVTNILYENMVMKNLLSDPITVNMGYGDASCAEWTGECALPVFENFTVRNVLSDGSGGSMNFVCLHDSHCTGFMFHNITIIGARSPYHCEFVYGTALDVSPPMVDCLNRGGAPPKPRPPPTPPPSPLHHCTIQTAKQRCYNDTVRGSVLPVAEPLTHDKTTLQVCASACFEGTHSLAGIDEGNHCYCGDEIDLKSAAVRAKGRPLPECEATPCHANKNQKCGGTDRILVYSFHCTTQLPRQKGDDETLSRSAANAASLPLPTPAQMHWHRGGKYGISALVHFNMATFFKDGDPGCTPENWVGSSNNGSSNPTSFAPTDLSTDDWAQAMKPLGIAEAVLVAKHGCGFTTWPTEVKLPNGTRYPYRSSVDVLGKFVASMTKAGIGHGFYYSFSNNFFLNKLGCIQGCIPACKHFQGSMKTCDLLPGQVNVTNREWELIAQAQVTELWTKYSNLTEIWFDGGVESDLKSNLTAILRNSQPSAVLFNFPKVGGAPVAGNPQANAGRWFGGNGCYNVSGAIWSTYCCKDPKGCISQTEPVCSLNTPKKQITHVGDRRALQLPDETACGLAGFRGCAATGDPADVECNTFMPAAHEDVIQTRGKWFYTPSEDTRPLAEMIRIYHLTAGRNTLLELDYAVDRRGRISPHHRAFYDSFGAWLDGCYGTPVGGARSLSFAAAVEQQQSQTRRVDEVVFALELAIPWAEAAEVDRVVIEEDQSKGQLVLSYRIAAFLRVDSSSTFAGNDELLTMLPPFGNGTAVGTRRIQFATGHFREHLQQLASSNKSTVTMDGAMQLRLEVTGTANGLAPSISRFAAFKSCPCPAGSPPGAEC